MIRGARPAHNLVKVHGYLQIDENSENQSPGGKSTLPNLSYVVLDSRGEGEKRGKQGNVEHVGGKNVEYVGGKNRQNVRNVDHRSPDQKRGQHHHHRHKGHVRREDHGAEHHVTIRDNADHFNVTSSSHENLSDLNLSNESNQSAIIDVTEDLYHTPRGANEKNKPVSYFRRLTSGKS